MQGTGKLTKWIIAYEEKESGPIKDEQNGSWIYVILTKRTGNREAVFSKTCPLATIFLIC